MYEKSKETLKGKHLEFAKSTNNRVWELLKKNERSPADDQEMLLAAYASLYHWMNAGTAVNHQRGYWLLSRVYRVLSQGEPALEWALKCQEITEKHLAEMNDFDLAFAREGLARAYAFSGDHERAKEQYDLAAGLGNKIMDPEDRQIFMKDFREGDWNKLIDRN